MPRLPTVDDALKHVLETLGGPPLVALDPADGPQAVRAAVEGASSDGVLVVVLTRTAATAALVRGWFGPVRRRLDGIESVQVAEGALVFGFVRRRDRPAAVPSPALPQLPADVGRPVAGARARDLDEATVRRWLRRADRLGAYEVAAPGTSEERALGRLGVLAHDGTTWRPTVAALVLAGHRPQLWMKGCALEVVVDDGSSVVEGTAAEILRQLREGPTADLDRKVLHEVVLHALLLRDWSAERAHERIVLRATGERVQLVHPGTLERRNRLLVELATGQGMSREPNLDTVAARLRRQGRRPFTLLEQNGTVRFVAELERRSEPGAVRKPVERAAPPKPSTPLVARHPPAPPAPTKQRPPPRPAGTSVSGASTAPSSSATSTAPIAQRRAPPERSSTTLVPSALPAPASPTVPTATALNVSTEAKARAEPSESPIRLLLARRGAAATDRTAEVLRLLGECGRLTARELAAALGCSRPVVGKIITALVSEGRVRALPEGRSPFQAYALAAA